MRRTIIISLLATSIVAAMGVWAIAQTEDALPQECASSTAGADITGGSAGYQPPSSDSLTGAGEEGTLNMELLLGGPSCLDVEYTVVVLDQNSDPLKPDPENDRKILETATTQGDGSSSKLTFGLGIHDDDSEVCVYATTFGKTKGPSRSLIDRAPDGTTAGSEEFTGYCITPDPGTASGGFR